MPEATKKPDYEVAAISARDAFVLYAGEEKWNKEIIFALQAIRNSDSLQKCSHVSLKNSVCNIALTGATLNPVLQQAWIIPRKGKACIDFGYRGLIQIAVSSGGVLDMDATVVYDNDEFYYEMGLNPTLKHIPFDGDRGKMKYVYAVAILPSGIKKFIVLDKVEIEAVKKSSAAFSKGGDTPWKGEFEAEMWRKTAVKKLYKMCPQTERMSTAVAVLNEHEGISQITNADKLKVKFEPEIETVECPDDNISKPKTDCDTCDKKKGCPAWDFVSSRAA